MARTPLIPQSSSGVWLSRFSAAAASAFPGSVRLTSCNHAHGVCVCACKRTQPPAGETAALPSHLIVNNRRQHIAELVVCARATHPRLEVRRINLERLRQGVQEGV